MLATVSLGASRKLTGLRACAKFFPSLGVLALGCSGLDPCPPSYNPDPTLQILVAMSLASGAVTTSGSCTAATCFTPVQGACVEWHATMTGGPGTSCLVTLSTPTGPRVRNVGGEEACNHVLGDQVSFQSP